jgi:hypothetical protein
MAIAFSSRTLVAAALACAAGAASASSAWAGPVDLTAAGSTDTINGAVFTQVDPDPTGTGVIRSFVRLQSPGRDTVEEGHNTSGRDLLNDENSSPQFTRDLLLSDLCETTINDTAYYTFLLDINEPNNANAGGITLSQLKVYVSPSAGLLATNPDTLGTKVYDLGVDNSVLMFDHNSGSGNGDYTVNIPQSLFDVAGGGTQYVYLWSRFENATGGFEEWASPCESTVAVPLPPAVWSGLITCGMAGLVGLRTRLRGMKA